MVHTCMVILNLIKKESNGLRLRIPLITVMRFRSTAITAEQYRTKIASPFHQKSVWFALGKTVLLKYAKNSCLKLKLGFSHWQSLINTISLTAGKADKSCFSH